MKLTANNKASWLSTVWASLEEWQDVYEGGRVDHEERWDDICTAMAWIAEELGVEQEEI